MYSNVLPGKEDIVSCINIKNISNSFLIYVDVVLIVFYNFFLINCFCHENSLHYWRGIKKIHSGVKKCLRLTDFSLFFAF